MISFPILVRYRSPQNRASLRGDMSASCQAECTRSVRLERTRCSMNGDDGMKVEPPAVGAGTMRLPPELLF